MIYPIFALGFAAPLLQGDWTLVNQRVLTPSAVHVQDLDGDGISDLVVGSGFDGLLVFSPGLGGGRFGAYRIISRDVFGFTGMAIFDADGDGDLDIVAGMEQSPWIGFYRNIGSGRFAIRTSADSTALRVSDVVAADLDGDGDLDVVAALADRGLVAWYENTGSDFGPRAVIANPGGNLRDLDAADLDGDGDQDLLYAESVFGADTGTFGVIQNLGGGVLAPATVLASGVSEARRIAAGDLDGDGTTDLVTASKELTWYSRTVGFTFVERDRLELQRPNSGIALLDTDANGSMEIAYSRTGSRVVVFGVDPVTGSIEGPILELPLSSDYYGVSLSVADVDGNGTPDLLGAANGIFLALGDGAGALGWQGQIPGPYELEGEPVFTDLDGDGDKDMIGSAIIADPRDSIVATYERLTETTFGPQAILEAGTGDIYGVAARDLDLDGLEDVYFYERSPGASGGFDFEVVWKRRLGAGTLAPSSVLFHMSHFTDYFPSPHFGDVDGDGDLDVVQTLQPTAGSRELVWHENDGSMTFLPGEAIESNPQVGDVVVADLNSDGRVDVLSSTQAESLRVHYASTASSTGFEPVQVFGPGGRAVTRFLVDADADGDLDILQDRLASNEPVEWVENLGNSFGDTHLIYSHRGDLQGAFLGDWNGDGNEDIIKEVITGGLRELVVIPGTGSGFFGQTTVQSMGRLSVWNNLAGVTDANGDGDVDLVLAMRSPGSSNNPQIRIHENPRRLGVLICPANSSSVGVGADLVISGSKLADRNRMVLTSTDLPPLTTVFFLTSPLSGITANAGGSQGNLCLSGSIGRYIGPGDVQQSDASGMARLSLDLTRTPDPALGLVPATQGQSMCFQAWFRDLNPGLTSNFSAARRVVLQ